MYDEDVQFTYRCAVCETLTDRLAAPPVRMELEGGKPKKLYEVCPPCAGKINRRRKA